jgi:hypothetical protein
VSVEYELCYPSSFGTRGDRRMMHRFIQFRLRSLLIFCLVVGSLIGLSSRYLEGPRQTREAEMDRFMRQLRLEVGRDWMIPGYRRQEQILTWPYEPETNVRVSLQKQKGDDSP